MSRPFDVSALFQRCVEPQKRMVGGTYKYAVHRFPIKNGIPLVEAMTDDLRPTKTPFWDALLQDGRKKR